MNGNVGSAAAAKTKYKRGGINNSVSYDQSPFGISRNWTYPVIKKWIFTTDHLVQYNSESPPILKDSQQEDMRYSLGE